MKQKLLDWGFDLTNKVFDTGLEVFEIEKDVIMVRVELSHDTSKSVHIGIDRNIAEVPNCNSTLGLFTILYQLALIEV